MDNSKKKEKATTIKPPKGTRDFLPLQMAIRRHTFEVITGVFQQHGAVEIDTPIFELKETLLGKYGEEGGKLIYDLQDQGGEMLSLRYDLTVPFARFVASYGIKKIKRYHIGKVYRRDNPSVQQGRYREFFQCDFDIAGENDPMIADAELLKIIDTIFSRLDLGQYTIKVSNRKLLDAMIQIAGIPDDKFKSVCSTIDKLDKSPWSEVEKELIEKKGCTPEQCAKLKDLCLQKGEPLELLAKLEESKLFEGNKLADEGLNELKLLFTYTKALNVGHLSFDLSLARGLDYYTGMIQETVLHGAQVGSISGGGRYDGLIGMFANFKVPSVGASIGIERVFSILEKKLTQNPQPWLKENPSDVVVASIPSKTMDMTTEKLKIYNLLWNANLKCDLNYKLNWNLGKQLTYANDQRIPLAVVFGEDEIKQGIVKVKSLNEKTEEAVKMADLVEYLKDKLKKVEPVVTQDIVKEVQEEQKKTEQ